MATLVAMGVLTSHGNAWRTLGFVFGFFVTRLATYALSSVVGGAMVGAGVAFTRAEDDTRATRVIHAVLGAFAGTASLLIGLSDYRRFHLLVLPYVSVPLHWLVGSALSLLFVGLVNRQRRAERDRLAEEMEAARQFPRN